MSERVSGPENADLIGPRSPAAFADRSGEGQGANASSPDSPTRLDGPLRLALFLLRAGPALILLLLIGVIAMTTPLFLTPRNIGNVLAQTAVIAVLSLGMLLVIVTRGIDLSVGSTLALATVTGALVFQAGNSSFLVIAAMIGAGLLVGLVNGVLFVKGRIPHPFIVTLATLTLVRGVALWLSDGRPIQDMPSDRPGRRWGLDLRLAPDFLFCRRRRRNRGLAADDSRCVGPLDLRSWWQSGGSPPDGDPGIDDSHLGLCLQRAYRRDRRLSHRGKDQRRCANIWRPGGARRHRCSDHRRRQLSRGTGRGESRSRWGADDRRDQKRHEPGQSGLLLSADRPRDRDHRGGRVRRVARASGEQASSGTGGTNMTPGSSIPFLSVRSGTKRFGGVLALDEVDIDVFAGEVLAVLGDNGAGKSTLIKCMSGVHRLDSGVIEVDGDPVQIHSPSDARALGIETVYQDLALFDNLSPSANFYAGRELAGPRWLPTGMRLLERKTMNQRHAGRARSPPGHTPGPRHTRRADVRRSASSGGGGESDCIHLSIGHPGRADRSPRAYVKRHESSTSSSACEATQKAVVVISHADGPRHGGSRSGDRDAAWSQGGRIDPIGRVSGADRFADRWR